MSRLFDLVMHPQFFHGEGRVPPFFEGWYYKLVDATEEHRFAIIPAVFFSQDPKLHHSFVQVLDGSTGRVSYHRYPAEAFKAIADPFEVHVGPNVFSLERFVLAIESAEQTLRGEVRFRGIRPWPVRPWAPGIMGPLGWLPFLECNHGVLSFDHELEGSLVADGMQVVLNGGRGYIEKDWGRSFPAAWIWIQSNHFDRSGTSLTASIARVPLGPISFRGFIVGLLHEGELHAFATWNGGSHRRLAVTDEHVHWVLERFGERLEILAHRAEPGELLGPSTSSMTLRVAETLNATVHVRLVQGRGASQRVVFEGTGRHAGLEVAGQLGSLLRP